MFKRVRVSLLALLVLGMAGAAFADSDPTREQIYEAARSGHLAEAQQMIDQVLRDHPQSAKAHFIASELDARIGDLGAARQQLATAKQLDPTLGFANAQALGALERQLTGMRAPVPGGGFGSPAFAPAARRPAVPWGWIIILAIGAFVIWNMLRSRAQRAYSQSYGPGGLPPGNAGMQPGYPPYPPPGGGSGLMGNLASGLAIGAGVVAGEELVRHVIDGNGNVVQVPAADLRDPPQNQDMGGNNFGTTGDDSWGGDSGGGGDWGGDSGGGGGGDWT